MGDQHNGFDCAAHLTPDHVMFSGSVILGGGPVREVIVIVHWSVSSSFVGVD
mgnify:CR=1 FL=1